MADAERRLHEYFRVKAKWRNYPLAFRFKAAWCIHEDVLFFMPPDQPFRESGNGEPYDYSHYVAGSVYRGPDFTAVEVDTQVDGNCYLMVFENALEADTATRNRCAEC